MKEGTKNAVMAFFVFLALIWALIGQAAQQEPVRALGFLLSAGFLFGAAVLAVAIAPWREIIASFKR